MNKQDYVREFLESLSVSPAIPQETIECAVALCDVCILQFQLISIESDNPPTWALSLCIYKEDYIESMAVILDRGGFVNRNKEVAKVSRSASEAMTDYIVFVRSGIEEEWDNISLKTSQKNEA